MKFGTITASQFVEGFNLGGNNMRLIVSAEHEETVQKAIQVIGDQKELIEHVFEDEVKMDYQDAFFELGKATVTVSTAGALDTALIDEIGKAYRERYNQAEETGDEVVKNRMYGAMLALKRIKDMVNAPQY